MPDNTQRASFVGPLPEPIESIDKYAPLLEKIKAMIESMIDEAFADRENPAEYYELIKQYVTAPTLTKILQHRYQFFMEAGKMFVVWQAGSGDGIYDCYEQKLLNAEWHDTDGDGKFANKNTISVEVLNLGEYSPHGTYVAALIAGDLLMSWQLRDNTGIIRWVGVPFEDCGIIKRIFEVQSEATGDGVYDCFEQTLDATEWADTAGDPKFDDKNAVSIEVLNLAELDPEATYVAHLAAGDLIAAWTIRDDEGNPRWVGVPFRQANADRPRLAYCKTDAGAGSTIVCYLDTDGTGTEITVNCNISGGSNLNAALRRLEDGDRMIVAKIGANWYCKEGFQGSEDCVCTSP